MDPLVIRPAFRSSRINPQREGYRASPKNIRSWPCKLEPIAKMSEQDSEAGELNKARKVLWGVFPANEETALPLYPCEEALDQPASRVASQPPSIRGLHFPVGTMRCDHLDAVLS